MKVQTATQRTCQRTPGARCLLAGALAALAWAGPAAGLNYFWDVQGSGSWHTPSNWDVFINGEFQQSTIVPMNQPPPIGDADVFINNGGTAQILTTIPDVRDISVGRGVNSVGINTLVQSGGNLFVNTPGVLRVGVEGGEGVYKMSGSAIQAKKQMYLGYEQGQSGAESAAVGTLIMNDASKLDVQFLLAGVGTQAGTMAIIELHDDAVFGVAEDFVLGNGTMTVLDPTPFLPNNLVTADIGGSVVIGSGSGRTARLDMNFGEMNVAGNLIIGQSGARGQVNLSGTASLAMVNALSSPIVIDSTGPANSGGLNITGLATLVSESSMVVASSQGRGGLVNQSGGTVILRDSVNGAESLALGDNGVYNLSGGRLKVQSLDATIGAFNFTGGNLDIAEAFFGDLVQLGGTISAGNSPGAYSHYGDYTLEAGEYKVEIAGTLQGPPETEPATPGYDYTVYEGDITLNGGELVVVIDGYVPVLGDSFDFMDWDTFSGYQLTGQFDAFDLSLATLTDGLSWAMSELYNEGMIWVRLSGDTDGDNDIDDGDLGAIFAAYTGPKGQPGSVSIYDMDNDGDIDDADLGATYANYTGPLAPSVPEPAALGLVAAGLLLGTRRRA